MATKKFNFSVGEYYHLYNRGVDKRIIFENTDDYNRFVLLIYLCNSNLSVDLGNMLSEGMTFSDVLSFDKGENIVAFGPYVLMPNHFHILAKEITDNGISKFMRKLLTGYSMYFNKKSERTGSLFESSFKAVHADKDEYLKYLFAYIHLNPVKLIDPNWKENGIRDEKTTQKYLSNYKYSSYFDYLGIDRLENKILQNNYFPDYFSNPISFEDFITDWLKYKNTEGVTFS